MKLIFIKYTVNYINFNMDRISRTYKISSRIKLTEEEYYRQKLYEKITLKIIEKNFYRDQHRKCSICEIM